MKIISARMTGFRNLADQELEFSPGLNVFLGRNAQGKTNLLEALDFFSLGRSHRGASAEELIGHDRSHLHVALCIECDDGRQQHLEFGMDRQGGRRFRVDGTAVNRRADLVGRLTTVFFWPQSNELVYGGPDKRRRFADQGISCLDPRYLRSLAAYQRAMKQKTRLLKDTQRYGGGGANVERELAAWNDDLASHAVYVGSSRAEWAEELQPSAEAIYRELAGDGPPLLFTYRPRLRTLGSLRETSKSPEEIHADILAEFDYIVREERHRGRPLTGLQFDDFEVRMGGMELKTYGSRGEARTAALSLVFAQSVVIFERRRVRPVLFLDDIFSELDRHRARTLQRRCAGEHQVFMATARAADLDGWTTPEMLRWRVDEGRLAPIP